MKNSSKNFATVSKNLSVAEKSSTATEPKTRRVLETRDQWGVVFKTLTRLVALQVKGEALPEDPRKAFGFKKASDQPHIKGYAFGLLAGFMSPKARKIFAAKYEVLADDSLRSDIALAIAKACRLASADRIEAVLSKAEKKQPKSFCEAVLAKLDTSSEATEKSTEPTPQPTVEPTAEPAPQPAKPKPSRKANGKAVKGSKPAK